MFAKVWFELFDKKHALVPDIQHSDKLKSMLETIQLETQQPLALLLVKRPMGVILKHFAFAKHRFDSSADPKAKLSLMLLPIATLLASLAADGRIGKEKQNRALHTLKLLDNRFVVSLGVSADWAVV